MREIEGLIKRQQVLAEFGEFAIQSDDLDAVLMEACRLVGEATGTGRAKVLEIQEGRQELLVRAGVGWAPDVVGTARLQMGERSSETYAIKAARPVVTQDIAKDDRFDVPHFMKQAGVVAFVNVPIFVPGRRPYGVLQIDDTRTREFGDDEIEFLRTYAMILGPVIDRLHLVEERARDRDVMRASEARHSLLIGSWAQAEWETDASGVVIADSPSWRAYIGQTVAEWLGYGWLDAVHPHDRANAEKQWREATDARKLVDAEYRLHAPDGSWRWTNVRAAPVLDADGCLVKWVGMNIDIEARKRAEAALRNSEERQAFQLQLSDALASLHDPADIQATAARLLAEQLGVGWCYFNEFDDRGTHATVLADFHREGLPSMVGIHDLAGERAFLDLMNCDAVLDMPDLIGCVISAQTQRLLTALWVSAPR